MPWQQSFWNVWNQRSWGCLSFNGQFAQTAPSSEIKCLACYQRPWDTVTSYVMSKTWWSPLAVSCKPEPHSSIVLAFEPLQIAEVQTCCIICSKEDPLYASSHWNTQLDRASLPNQSGVHWFCSWLEEMVPWVQKPLLPDFFLTNDRLSLRFENLPVTFSGGLIERWQHWFALFHCLAKAQKLERH